MIRTKEPLWCQLSQVTTSRQRPRSLCILGGHIQEIQLYTDKTSVSKVDFNLVSAGKKRLGHFV